MHIKNLYIRGRKDAAALRAAQRGRIGFWRYLHRIAGGIPSPRLSALLATSMALPTVSDGPPAIPASYFNEVKARLDGLDGGTAGGVWVNAKSPTYGAVGDGVEDDTAALKTWAASLQSGDVGLVPPGTYNLTLASSLSIASGVRLHLEGAVFKRQDSTDKPTFAWQGSQADSSPLTANASEGDVDVTVADGSKFSVDDVVMILDEEFGTTTAFGVTNGCKRFMARVASVSGNVVTLDTPLLESYTTADSASLLLFSTVTGSIRGGRTEGASHARFEYATDIHIENIEADGFGTEGGVTVIRTLGFTVRNALLTDPVATGGGEGYGVHTVAAFDGTIENIRGRGCRHLVLIGDSSANISGGNFVHRNAVIDTLNTHGTNSRYLEFHGVVCLNSSLYTVTIENDEGPDHHISVTGIVSRNAAISGVNVDDGAYALRLEGIIDGVTDQANGAAINFGGRDASLDFDFINVTTYGLRFNTGCSDTRARLRVNDWGGGSSNRACVLYFSADASKPLKNIDLDLTIAGISGTGRIVDMGGLSTGRIEDADLRLRCRDAGGLITVNVAKTDRAHLDVYAIRSAAGVAEVRLEAGCTNVHADIQSDDRVAGVPFVDAGGTNNTVSYQEDGGPRIYEDLAFHNGPTAQRPPSPSVGVVFFDTILGIPIWYDGTNWVDATGATV